MNNKWPMREFCESKIRNLHACHCKLSLSVYLSMSVWVSWLPAIGFFEPQELSKSQLCGGHHRGGFHSGTWRWMSNTTALGFQWYPMILPEYEGGVQSHGQLRIYVPLWFSFPFSGGAGMPTSGDTPYIVEMYLSLLLFFGHTLRYIQSLIRSIEILDSTERLTTFLFLVTSVLESYWIYINDIMGFLRGGGASPNLSWCSLDFPEVSLRNP